MSSLLSGHYSELLWQKESMLDKAARHRFFFSGSGFCVFAGGFGGNGCFGGGFLMVNVWWIVVVSW
jgi:hypothetical protein